MTTRKDIKKIRELVQQTKTSSNGGGGSSQQIVDAIVITNNNTKNRLTEVPIVIPDAGPLIILHRYKNSSLNFTSGGSLLNIGGERVTINQGETVKTYPLVLQTNTTYYTIGRDGGNVRITATGSNTALSNTVNTNFTTYQLGSESFFNVTLNINSVRAAGGVSFYYLSLAQKTGETGSMVKEFDANGIEILAKRKFYSKGILIPEPSKWYEGNFIPDVKKIFDIQNSSNTHLNILPYRSNNIFQEDITYDTSIVGSQQLVTYSSRTFKKLTLKCYTGEVLVTINGTTLKYTAGTALDTFSIEDTPNINTEITLSFAPPLSAVRLTGKKI